MEPENWKTKKMRGGRRVIEVKHEDASIKYTLNPRASSEINDAEDEIQKSMLESIAKSLAGLIDLHDDALQTWKPHRALEELDCTAEMLARRKKRLQDEWYTEMTNYS